MSKKKRVLTILNSANMGGIENTLLSCLRHMDRKQHEISLLCFKSGGNLEAEFKSLGVEIWYIKKTGLILCDFIQLLFIIISKRIDIVHSRFGYTSGGFVLATKFSRIMSIVSIHSIQPATLSKQKNKIVNYILKLSLKAHKLLTLSLATIIVGHSKSNLNANYPYWKKDSKFRLIYNGIDFRHISNDDSECTELNSFVKRSDLILLHIGSFREAKNHKKLIEAFYTLQQSHLNAKLILVGSGPLEKKTKEQVRKMQIEDKVHFAGYDKQISKYFRKAHVFVLPSVIEGLGNVLLEAQYMNIPICASNLPPLYESVYEGYHKYFFEPADSQACHKSIVKMITDLQDGKLNETIKNARRYVANNFSIESMVNEMSTIYSEQ